jgi:hypothetical protein
MTQKQLLLEKLAEGKRERHLLIREVADDSGAKIDSVRRRLNELVSERRVVYERKDGKIYVVQSADNRSPDDQDLLETERKLRVAKDHNAALQKKVKALHREDDAVMRIVDAIHECGMVFDPVPPPKVIIPSSELVQETSVLHLGDMHVDELVDVRDTGGLAEYNVDIATVRTQSLAEKMIDIKQNLLLGYSLQDLVLFSLGDIVSTNIHGIMDNTGDCVVDSLFHAAYLYAQLLFDFARIYRSVKVICVPGNHGRVTEEIRYKQPYNNWDYVLAQFVSVMCMNQPNISFKIPRSLWVVESVEDWDWLVVHGSIAKSWQGIPFYGILRSLKNIRDLLDSVHTVRRRQELLDEEEDLMEQMGEVRDDMWKVHGIRFDYCAMGHFHTSGTLDVGTGEVFMNGSMIGASDYSIQKMQAGNAPRHWFHGMNRKHGATWRYNLDLDRVPDGMEQRYRVGGAGLLVDEVRELEKEYGEAGFE